MGRNILVAALMAASGAGCVDLAMMLRRCFVCGAIAWKICVQAMTGLRTI
jgi:hypothetical protein